MRTKWLPIAAVVGMGLVAPRLAALSCQSAPVAGAPQVICTLCRQIVIMIEEDGTRHSCERLTSFCSDGYSHTTYSC